jgi:hypothetical protein
MISSKKGIFVFSLLAFAGAGAYILVLLNQVIMSGSRNQYNGSSGSVTIQGSDYKLIQTAISAGFGYVITVVILLILYSIGMIVF